MNNMSSSVIRALFLWRYLSKSRKLFAEAPGSRVSICKLFKLMIEITGWIVETTDMMASFWDVSEIFTFFKQVTIMVVDTWSRAIVSMYAASRLLNLEIGFLLTKAIMMRQTRMGRYFLFKICMTLWSTVCLMGGVVFFGRETNSQSFQILMRLLGNYQWS